MNSLQKYRFSFLAGFFAAGGSFFGKLPSLLKDGNECLLLDDTLHIYADFILCKCLPIVLMIVSNLLNWRYFLKALQMLEQTLTVTVLTAASNYVTTFILGTFVFMEPFSLLSILGCTFIVFGLLFLGADTGSHREKLKTR